MKYGNSRWREESGCRAANPGDDDRGGDRGFRSRSRRMERDRMTDELRQNRGGSVRSMRGGPAPVVERVDPADAAAARVLASLRRAWVEERRGPQVDPGFEDELAGWWRREAPQRLAWVASIDGPPVGMLNLLEFTRMPARRAGRAVGLPRRRVRAGRAPRSGHRTGHARRRGRRGPGAWDYVRIVLSPSAEVGPVLPACRVPGPPRSCLVLPGSTP